MGSAGLTRARPAPRTGPPAVRPADLPVAGPAGVGPDGWGPGGTGPSGTRQARSGASQPEPWLEWRRVPVLVARNCVLVLLAIALGPAAVAGWTPVVLTSGSMGPLLHAGDVVLVDRTRTEPELGVVVTLDDPAVVGRWITHRVVDVDSEGMVWTKGDANAGWDPVPAPPEAIVGHGRLAVPVLGLPVVWWGERRAGHLLAAAVISVLVLVASSRRRPRRRPVHIDRPRRVPPRIRRRVPGALAAGLALTAVLGALVGTPTAAAAFTATTTSSGSTLAATAVAAPASLSGENSCIVSGGIVQHNDLWWPASSSSFANGQYEIWRATAEAGPYALRTTVSALSYRDSSVANSTTYYYRVRARAFTTWRSPGWATREVKTKGALCSGG